MIRRIVSFSIRHNILIVFLTLAASIAGFYCMREVPLDAIPDLGDPQVIIFSQWDRSPDIIEDQVTFPLVSSMMGLPKVKDVRGYSEFGYSYVHVTFQDNTDLYWARSRVMESLASALPRLPEGVKTELGPDATGLGWIYQYVVVDRSGKRTLQEIRSFQDWFLRYQLKAVPGVADVASLGGDVRQYQVNINPTLLKAYGLTIDQVVNVVRDGNKEASGKLIEFGGTEYIVRGRGAAHSLQDFENIVVDPNESGTPIRIKDIGKVTIGPEIRRGVADLNGREEVVSGTIIMRQGENAKDVIKEVKKKIASLEPMLPAGLRIEPVYDRSVLIDNAIKSLAITILEVAITVSLIIILFLADFTSALIPLLTIPAAVFISFIPFKIAGISADIMSLGGIAIAVGALVDASIVVVEQVHRKSEEYGTKENITGFTSFLARTISDVARPSFFSLVVIAVSFLPITYLGGQEGRLFSPLAYAKTFAMLTGAILAITFDPAVRSLIGKGNKSHINNYNYQSVGRLSHCKDCLYRAGKGGAVWLADKYEVGLRWALRNERKTIILAGLAVCASIPPLLQLKRELMPPIEEGSLLYMPSTAPSISVSQAKTILQAADATIAGFPEVKKVFGKAGRIDSALDPAPLSMIESVITLKPQSQWRSKPTWYSSWAPEVMKQVFRKVTPDRISTKELIAEMNKALALPGVSNAWTMPIRARIDMINSGIKTPLGIKVSGPDINSIDIAAQEIQDVLSKTPGVRAAYAEQAQSGYYVDISWDRVKSAEVGIDLGKAQTIVQNAIGGENVSTVINGRERYSVNVRLFEEVRRDIGALRKLVVPFGNNGGHIPLGQIANVFVAKGPAMIRNEDGLLTNYIFVDADEENFEKIITKVTSVIGEKVALPAGTIYAWSGQSRSLEKAEGRLGLIIVLALVVIISLVYINTWSVSKTVLVLLAVPFSAIGAVWLIFLMGYQISIGVWVGFIALLGIDVETGIFMLLYLDLACDKALREGRLSSTVQLQEAIIEGAAKRLRPKAMTVLAISIGLLPLLWADGIGSGVLSRMAVPLLGGVGTSFLLELIVYPPIYKLLMLRELKI